MKCRPPRAFTHPNVVAIHDYGEDDSAGTYLVMEFLEGQSLTTLLSERTRLPLDLVCRIAIQLASALSATHSRGLIHRDLKPSNIRVLPDGLVKVLDFGLVKAYSDEAKDTKFTTLTTSGIAFGTPWYMSPEQAGFKTMDPRSDIYSLGIVLYELLCGRPPFLGTNPLELIDAQRNKPVPLPRHLDPPIDVAPTMELLLLKMLNKEPARRHQTMNELIEDIYHVATEESLDLADSSLVVDLAQLIALPRWTPMRSGQRWTQQQRSKSPRQSTSHRTWLRCKR